MEKEDENYTGPPCVSWGADVIKIVLPYFKALEKVQANFEHEEDENGQLRDERESLRRQIGKAKELLYKEIMEGQVEGGVGKKVEEAYALLTNDEPPACPVCSKDMYPVASTAWRCPDDCNPAGAR